jgi:hypothetical protein
MNRTCVSCQWYEADKHGNVAFAKCRAPQNRVRPDMGKFKLVDPSASIQLDESDKWELMYCDLQRRYGWCMAIELHRCGKRGRWWVPKTAQGARAPPVPSEETERASQMKIIEDGNHE